MLNQLTDLSYKLGGQLILLEEQEFSNLRKNNMLSVAPFVSYSLGIDYDNKNIFYSQGSDYGHVIHEMAHVFASKTPPFSSDEISFIGWEFAVAKHINLDIEKWCSQLSDYMIDDNTAFINLPTKEKELFLKERYDFCISEGMVSKDGIPLSIR